MQAVGHLKHAPAIIKRMLANIRRVVQWIEEIEAPLFGWFAGLTGIMFVRFFIENISSPTPSFPAVFDAPTLLHYFLFFWGAFVSLALVLYLFIPDIKRVSKFLALGFPIIWLAPILDLLYSHGNGYRITYVFTGDPGGFLQAFLNVGRGGSIFGGLSPGLRVEILAIAIGMFLYVWLKTNKFSRAIGAGLLGYVTLFLWMVLPGLVALAASGQTSSSASVFSNLATAFSRSRLLGNFIRPTANVSYTYATELIFNLGMSVIIYLIDIVLAFVWFVLWNYKKVIAFAKSVRPARMGYYFGMIVIGALGALRTENLPVAFGWFDGALIVVLLFAYFFAFMFAISVNDVADEKVDRVNRAERSLFGGTLGREDISGANFLFFLLMAVGGFLCGYWVLFALLVFTAVYYVYSAPPLRLKRVPIISTFLLSFATLTTLFGGFFFADANKLVADMPIRVIAMIIVCLTLALNFKDIKDVAGDRAENIWTLPVIFGEKNGRRIVGVLLGLAFLAVPAILNAPLLTAPSIFAAVLGYAFCALKNYEEWRIFALYFAYVAVVGILLWMHPLPA